MLSLFFKLTVGSDLIFSANGPILTLTNLSAKTRLESGQARLGSKKLGPAPFRLDGATLFPFPSCLEEEQKRRWNFAQQERDGGLPARATMKMAMVVLERLVDDSNED